MRQRLPGIRTNKVRKSKRSMVYTIPSLAAQELDIDDGEVPADVEINPDERELILVFETSEDGQSRHGPTPSNRR